MLATGMSGSAWLEFLSTQAPENACHVPRLHARDFRGASKLKGAAVVRTSRPGRGASMATSQAAGRAAIARTCPKSHRRCRAAISIAVTALGWAGAGGAHGGAVSKPIARPGVFIGLQATGHRPGPVCHEFGGLYVQAGAL